MSNSSDINGQVQIPNFPDGAYDNPQLQQQFYQPTQPFTPV
jgi:hypothetical protein